MSDGQVDAVKLLNVLQEKLRNKEDENSLLQARVLMLNEEVENLKSQLPEPIKEDDVPEIVPVSNVKVLEGNE